MKTTIESMHENFHDILGECFDDEWIEVSGAGKDALLGVLKTWADAYFNVSGYYRLTGKIRECTFTEDDLV